LYECLLEETPSQLSFELDYYVPWTCCKNASDSKEAVEARDGEFAERK
jgi:hypothetical protein